MFDKHILYSIYCDKIYLEKYELHEHGFHVRPQNKGQCAGQTVSVRCRIVGTLEIADVLSGHTSATILDWEDLNNKFKYDLRKIEKQLLK